MGEPTYSLKSGQLLSPIMRISRGKMFLYFAVLGAMCLTIVLLRNAHSNLKALEGQNSKCQQKHDSLSAQLQVIYEQKTRLEKSFQQEKVESQRNKKEMEKQIQEGDSKLQKEKEKIQSLEEQIKQMKITYTDLESDKKLSETSLKKDMEDLQAQKEEEISKLQAQVAQVLIEKEKLENTNSELIGRISQHANNATLCHMQYQMLDQKLAQCKGVLQNIAVNSVNPSQDKVLDQRIKHGPAPLTKEKVNPINRPMVQKETKDDIAVPLQSNNINQNAEKYQGKFMNANDIGDKNNNSLNMSVQYISNQNSAKAQNELNDSPVIKKPLNSEDILAARLDQVYAPDRQNESENLPQVQPPDNANAAAERGEYGNGVLPEQLEQPQADFNNANGQIQKKNLFPVPNANNINNFDAAQVRDMLDKSPGDVNENNGNPPINIPPPHDQKPENAMKQMDQLQKGKPLAQMPGMLDKNYNDEDEDDQGDNDDDHRVLGAQQKFFQDFADQDSLDNHGRNEEGVMVQPK